MPEASNTQPDFPFVGKVTLIGTLTTRTGLHVGAGGAGINPRGVDAPIIRDPMAQRPGQSGKVGSALPYIPGSSLRGKLRMLLVRRLNKPVREVAQAGGRFIRLHACDDENCEVCRLFGSVPMAPQGTGGQAGSTEPWSLAASLHVADLRLKDPQHFVGNELKNENALDRISAQSNPRQIERVPQETVFSLSLTYYVRRVDHFEEDLHNVLATLALLQDDTLGGHGSRGYGAVSISLDEIRSQRFGPQEHQARKRTEHLNLPLENAREKIGYVLPEIKAFLVSLPETTAPQPRVQEQQQEMTLCYVACLHFNSPLHVGEPRVGLEGCVDAVSSDTLFSALANAWVTLYGKQSLEALLAEFGRSSTASDHPIPFRLSSAFPYIGDRFFFPKPFFRTRRNEEEAETKALKDLKLLPANLFHSWITGGLTKSEFDEQVAHEVEKQKDEKRSTKRILPRVRLDRLDLTSNLYFCGQVYFHEEGGLYFLVQGKEAMLQKLREALELLGKLGLGGERALGFGRFKVRAWKPILEVESLRFLSRNTGRDAFVTLSLYHPSPQELSSLLNNEGDNLLGYQLIERGGWVDSPALRFAIRKKTCRLFTEGAVFRTGPQGCIVDVTPDAVTTIPHRVYRYGFAFPVGMVLQHE